MSDPAADLLRRLSLEDLLLPVLIQLVVILAAARLFALLFRRLGQPAVVGEIAAGLALGPSVLGALLPDVAAAIFQPAIGPVPPELADALLAKIFGTLSHLGLIFLLFLVGLEFDFRHLRGHGPAALAIAAVGVVVPFGLGVGVAWLLWPHVEPHPSRPDMPVPQLGFVLFLGVALAITAMPVLGRILMELHITRTRLGTLTITAAAVDDACGWILLASVAAIVNAAFEIGPTLFLIGGTVAFGLGMIFGLRPLLLRWLGWLRVHGRLELGPNSMALLLAVLLSCAILTNLIGIFAVFGAFFLGAILSSEADFRQAVNERLRELITVLFLPIFFAYTGLRTDIGTLPRPDLWLLGGLLLAAAVLGKLGGCGLTAWASGLNRRESAIIGVLMNTRGLMALVVVNLGHELGVLPRSVYCMLVLMALLTTVMTTPILLRLMPGTELESHVRSSGFLRASPRNGQPTPQGDCHLA